jgi:hypothetical protein
VAEPGGEIPALPEGSKDLATSLAADSVFKALDRREIIAQHELAIANAPVKVPG